QFGEHQRRERVLSVHDIARRLQQVERGITDREREAPQDDDEDRKTRHQQAVRRHRRLHRLDRRGLRHLAGARPSASSATCLSRSTAWTPAGPPQFHKRPGITTTRVRSESAASTGWRRSSVASAGGPSRLALTIKTSTPLATTASNGTCP